TNVVRATVSSITINIPTGVEQGDVMIANISSYINGNNTTPATLSGWTQVSSVQTGDTRGYATILYKVAGASEPTSYTFTIEANSTAASGAIVAFSGVDNSNPIDVTGTFLSADPANGTTLAPASITTNTANAAVLMFVAMSRTAATTSATSFSSWTATSPSSLTELYDAGNADNSNNGTAVGAAWAIKSAAGATGAGSVTISPSQSRTQGAILIALRPCVALQVTATASTNSICGSSGTINLTGTVANSGPVVVGTENFENTSTYTASGGSTKTGTSGSGDRPASVSFVVSPTTSYWVNNGTATITTSNFSGLTNGASKSVSLRLASFSIGSTSNGAESSDYVRVAISLNGGSSYSSELEVNGGSTGNSFWGFSSGTGTATITYDGDNTRQVFAPSGGGVRTSDGYSTLVINLPTSATQVRVQVTMLNNSGNEAWVIDDIVVSQTNNITYAWTSSPAGFTSSSQNPTGVSVSQTTTYTLTATNSTTGCQGSDTALVTVSAVPTTSNAGTDISQCNSSTFTMAANNPSVGTGAWSLVSGT
ncbi:MAG: hypothetical protein ACKOQY_04985, partial [Bacteroidota bacterium]